MTPTQTVKQYSELAVAQSRTFAEQAKTPFLAVVGACDLAVERAKTVVAQFRSKAEALPGEAQVQADLAVKEARTRATEAAGTARTTAQQLAVAVRPEALRSTVDRPGRDRPHPGCRDRGEAGRARRRGRRGAAQAARLPPGRASRRARPSTPSRTPSRTCSRTARPRSSTCPTRPPRSRRRPPPGPPRSPTRPRPRSRTPPRPPRRPPRRPSRPPNSGAKPVTAKKTHGQEDRAAAQGLARQGDLGPRDPRPDRQAGEPDRGAREEELILTSDVSTDQGPGAAPALRGPVLFAAGGSARRGRCPAATPFPGLPAGTLPVWRRSTGYCSWS